MLNIEKVKDFFNKNPNKVISFNDILKELAITPEQKKPFKRLLKDLSHTGEISKLRNRHYILASARNVINGYFRVTSRGRGFIIPTDNNLSRITVSSHNVGTAIDGDTIVAQLITTQRDTTEGRIINVTKRAHPTIVGMYSRFKKGGLVAPRNKKINKFVYIPRQYTPSMLSDGMFVVCKINEWTPNDDPLFGEIVEILGDEIDEFDTTMILKDHGARMEFPKAVQKALKEIPAEIPETEIANRKDFRDLMIFTIDGETAKDFDDAISIERVGNDKYKLGVHIADVSYYVEKESFIDQEAFERGTSIYPLNFVVPMLPKQLSNNLCSLKPAEDRLAVSVIMIINKEGEVEEAHFYNSIINSRHRLTYTQVDALFNGDAKIEKKLDNVKNDLFILRELSKVLHKMRLDRGSLEMDIPEVSVALDDNGKPTNVFHTARLESHGIIEECMLAANETVAQKIDSLNIPSIYRIHEHPAQRKLREVTPILRTFGYKIKEKITAADLQRILIDSEKEPHGYILETMVLRSMMRAEYSANKCPHFGLASECYTHFTSPIRRYPDLVVHRILKDIINGHTFSEAKIDSLQQTLPNIAQHASDTERRADLIEMECVKLKSLQFMQDKIGEEFEGIISGIMGFGFFVELEKYPIEGLVPVRTLNDDFYDFDERAFMLVGKRTGKRFHIGEEVLVEVIKVDIQNLEMDLEFLSKVKKKKEKQQ